MKIAIGESKSYTLDLVGADNQPLPLAGKRLYVTLAQRGQVVLELANTAGGGDDTEVAVVTDPGQIRFFIDAADSAAFSPETLHGEVWVGVGTARTRVMKFQIWVDASIQTTFPTAP